MTPRDASRIQSTQGRATSISPFLFLFIPRFVISHPHEQQSLTFLSRYAALIILGQGREGHVVKRIRLSSSIGWSEERERYGSSAGSLNFPFLLF